MEFSNNRSPQIYLGGFDEAQLLKKLPLPFLPRAFRPGEGMGIRALKYCLYPILTPPTPKGVGYDGMGYGLDVHFLHFLNPKFIAPRIPNLKVTVFQSYCLFPAPYSLFL